MDGLHCTCCHGNAQLKDEAERAVVALKADVADLKNTIDTLRGEVKELEELRDELNRDVDNAREDANDSDQLRDEALDRRDQMYGELREEKARHLEFLRRLEFSHKVWQCPVCKLDWMAAGKRSPCHADGCDLKLSIFRLDHELNRSEFVHL